KSRATAARTSAERRSHPVSKPPTFAGLKLSESAPIPVDQRLFGGEPVRPQSVPVSSPPLSQEVGKEGNREVGREAARKASQPAGRSPTFDLREKPYRKDSFLFTSQEWEALEDLKLDLRRGYAVDATKTDLARCAMHVLIEDFRRKGEDSLAVRRLREKGGKQGKRPPSQLLWTELARP